MAFFNKLNNVARSAAKSAAELTNDAIGTGKIAMKIKPMGDVKYARISLL